MTRRGANDGIWALQRSLEIINRNIQQMFIIRDYDVDESITQDQMFSMAQTLKYSHIFTSSSRNMVTFLYTHEIENTTLVKLPKNELTLLFNKYNSDVAEYIENNDTDDTVFTMMIIVGNTDSKSFNRIIKLTKQLCAANDVTIEVFTRKFFALNPLEHVLVPRHIIHRNVQNVDAFLSKFMMRDRIPPLIYTSDTISRLFHAQLGDYFEIHRPNSTTGIAIMIRRVIVNI